MLISLGKLWILLCKILLFVCWGFFSNSQSASGKKYFIVLLIFLNCYYWSLCFETPKWSQNGSAAFQIKRTVQSLQDMASSQLCNACRSIYNQLSFCCIIDKPHIKHRKVNSCTFFHLRSSVESLGPQPLFILSFTNICCEFPPGATH